MTKKLLIGLVVLAACNNSQQSSIATINQPDNSPPIINYSVVNSFPHDTSAYTEGFLVHDGLLYESTGYEEGMPENRGSFFGVVNMKTGKIEVKAALDKHKYFGEGIAFLNGKVYQLTYRTKKGFVYDAKTFKKTGEFTFPSTEGWGMTTDGKYLIMSDGTSNISYLDPDNFKLVKVLGVTDNNGPVPDINELELINGYMYANQYRTNYILKIDTASGKVVGRLDFTTLDNEAKNKNPDAAEMNGIAYDPVAKKVYVTGKLWPNIYEVKFNY
ncbi:MAG: glutaminyl-peptide cyclotransferase [Bacteroidetes bacterium]|nr:glutaminyl-peptide cyclotransferase [Bacteroidota bacterium]MBS1974416.1 glutaminyl-peptide cyclotransferase [Bacteroidota bacterium]